MRFLDPLADPSKLDSPAGGGVVRLSALSPIATVAALSAMRALRIGIVWREGRARRRLATSPVGFARRLRMIRGRPRRDAQADVQAAERVYCLSVNR